MYVDVAKDDSVEDKDRLSIFVNDDVKALIAIACGEFYPWRHDWVCDIVEPVSKAMTVLSGQLLFSNCSAEAIWYLMRGGFYFFSGLAVRSVS